MIVRSAVFALSALLAVSAVAQEDSAPDAASAAPEPEVSAAPAEAPSPAQPQTEENPVVILKTSKGDIKIELYPAKAPDTVANFLKYVDDGFYNGTIFHRVINGFMIQGGGFTKDLVQKPTRPPVKNEAGNGLKNDRGTIAMARTGDPHSATAQFFINVVDNHALNFTSPDPRGYGYCVFGKVIEGMDTVDAIKAVPTGAQDVPRETVVIQEAVRAPGS